jgi:hypothetical protein
MSPANIQNCDLHEGDWGTVGSVIFFSYFHDGKEKVAKEIIEAIDEEKKSVSFKVIEGDLMELYKNFTLTVHVDTNGEDNLVTWTFNYDKLHEGIPEPNSLMEFCLNVTKDIETHHLKSDELEAKNGVDGKLVKQINIKSDGDVFHEIFRDRPYHLSTMSPTNIQNCDLHEGDWGTVGSVICFSYFHDGKDRVAKEIIEAIDEGKKSVTFKVIEGDLLEQYKNFTVTVHVDTSGEDNLVTWTFDYEKLDKDVPEPNTLMDFCLNLTKDIETHHLK